MLHVFQRVPNDKKKMLCICLGHCKEECSSGPSQQWWLGFKKQHPKLKPDSLDRGQAQLVGVHLLLPLQSTLFWKLNWSHLILIVLTRGKAKRGEEERTSMQESWKGETSKGKEQGGRKTAANKTVANLFPAWMIFWNYGHKPEVIIIPSHATHAHQ